MPAVGDSEELVAWAALDKLLTGALRLQHILIAETHRDWERVGGGIAQTIPIHHRVTSETWCFLDQQLDCIDVCRDAKNQAQVLCH